MRSLLCFSLAASLSVAPLKAAPQAAEFEFARTTVENFRIRATTDVAWNDHRPYVRGVTCVGDNEYVSFIVDHRTTLTDLRFAFLGLPAADGDREQITLLGDTLWLFIDGKRLEYRNSPIPRPHFTNYSYPPAPVGEIVLPTWRGYAAVRQSEVDPFVHLSRIYGELVGAQRIEWSFKARNWKQVNKKDPSNALPEGWQTRRYPVETRGLKSAIDWCTRAVSSPQARMLPANLMNDGQK